MDSAEDSLTMLGKLAKECTDSPRALRVETTGKNVSYWHIKWECASR
jgi:hypothetical protein